MQVKKFIFLHTYKAWFASALIVMFTACVQSTAKQFRGSIRATDQPLPYWNPVNKLLASNHLHYMFDIAAMTIVMPGPTVNG